MYSFLLKLLPFIVQLIPLYHRHKKAFYLLLISVFVSTICNNLNFFSFNMPRLQTISETKKLDNITILIDQVLAQMGSNSFISWLIIEEKNGKYILYFRDVRGIVPNGTVPISVKYLNKIYLEEVEVDRNCTILLNSIKEFDVSTINKQECLDQGYTTIFKILNKTNLHLDNIKIVPVKKNKRIIWLFTLFSNSILVSEEMKDNNLKGIAMQAKHEILELN